MPLDGVGNYFYPPGTRGIEDTTIESEKYNDFLDDLTMKDLNVARPITRGGTGATTAAQALINLEGEKTQQVVTNYDSVVWQSGSFYSSNALGQAAPVDGHRFLGYVAVQDANNIVVDAFDLDSTPTGAHYQRIKKDGVWVNTGLWTNVTPGQYVLKTGDTMTGSLILNPATGIAAIALNPTQAAQQAGITFSQTGVNKWSFGKNTDDSLVAHNFANSIPAFVASPTTSLIVVAGNPTAPLGIATKQFAENLGAGKVSKQGDTMGGNLELPPGPYSSTSAVPKSYVDAGDAAASAAASNANAAATAANNNANTRLLRNGPDTFAGNLTVSGTLDVSSTITCFGSGIVTGSWNVGATINAINAYYTGVVHVSGGNYTGHSIWWSGGVGYKFYVKDGAAYIGVSNSSGNPTGADVWKVTGTSVELMQAGGAWKPGGGSWNDNSDERIKNVLGDYENGLDAINALRPVRYTFKGNDTAEDAPISENLISAPYDSSSHYAAAKEAKEYIGLIAQECEQVMPEMVSKRRGRIDGKLVDDMRDLDTTALIFALVNAVQELTARIEALEG